MHVLFTDVIHTYKNAKKQGWNDAQFKIYAPKHVQKNRFYDKDLENHSERVKSIPVPIIFTDEVDNVIAVKRNEKPLVVDWSDYY